VTKLKEKHASKNVKQQSTYGEIEWGHPTPLGFGCNFAMVSLASRARNKKVQKTSAFPPYFVTLFGKSEKTLPTGIEPTTIGIQVRLKSSKNVSISPLFCNAFWKK